MKTLDMSEVYNFAITLEENGHDLYRKFAQTTKDAEAKKTFTHFADEELKHKEIFEDMQSKVRKYEPSESRLGEYSALLSAYADSFLIAYEEIRKGLPKTSDPIKAIDFAVQIEKDSILYYQEIKRFVPQNQHDALESVIAEERKHYLEFSTLKKTYT